MKAKRFDKTPPLADKLLLWYCDNAAIEDLRGDLEELFYINLTRMSARRARLIYWLQIMSLIFSYAVRRRKQKSSFNVYSSTSINVDVLRNYFKIATRSLVKNKMFSVINVLGIAVGMAAFLFIVHYVRYEKSYENFHAKATNIWRITLDQYNGSEFLMSDCETHAALGPTVKEKMPEVEDFVRMFKIDGLHNVKAGAKKFLDEGLYFADSSVFNIFSLHILEGDSAKALRDPMQVTITESRAEKYFGRKNNVLGEIISIDGNPYSVTAVISDLQPNTHLKFCVLASHTSLNALYKERYDEGDWIGNNEFTYLLMKPGTSLKDFNAKLTALSLSLKDKLNNARYTAEPIKDIHLFSHKNFEPDVNGDGNTVYLLMTIAWVIIVIAWVNYVNLSTARAIGRAREVGVRKVIGSRRMQLVLQFLTESVILNILSGIIALILFYSILPFLRDLTGQPLPLDFIFDPVFWLFFFSLISIGSLLSGAYPAFVLSSFQPVAVLKGRFQSSIHGKRLRKGLVIFQFSATIVLIIFLCAVYLQIEHLRSYDIGMNINRTVVVRAPQLEVPDSVYESTYESRYQSLKSELLNHSEIQKVARSTYVPGMPVSELRTARFTRKGESEKEGQYRYNFFWVDADFVPLLDMKLIKGRNFENGTSNTNQVIINEEAVQRLGFSSNEEAIGSQITTTRWKGDPYTIIGVLKNSYLNSPKEAPVPMLFMYWKIAGFFTVRVRADDMTETIGSIKQAWDKVFPGMVFHYFFLDQNYDQQYLSDIRFGKVTGYFSGLAVLIACLGLFGLSSFTMLQRLKEISIRKVMGASVPRIVRLLSSDFMKFIFIATVLSVPIAYFAIKEWLSGYVIRIDLNVWLFVLPIIFIFLIALITVSFQTVKTARANPIRSLKQE